MKSQPDSAPVTSGPGFIRIRGRSIQDLARKQGFLEISSYLISGSLEEESPFVRAARSAVGGGLPKKWKNRAIVLQRDPRSLVYATLDDLESYPSTRRNGAANAAMEAGLVWGKILLAFIHTYQSRPADAGRGILTAFLDTLSERPLIDEELRCLETHMSLQIESPASPSSRGIQQALEQGLGLLQGIRRGCDEFWQENHGLASAELAKLLLEFQRQPVSAVEQKVAALFLAGRKIPGFGSHEHKGGVEDPRVPVYVDLWRELSAKEAGGWLEEASQHLRSAFENHRARQGKAKLPVNPDFYMALLHLACDVPPERIPLSFLLARMVGWSGAYVEHRAGRREE